jgi:hypothetical protein
VGDDRNVLRSIGYFDDPDQDEPTFDPGPDGICPVCNKLIGLKPRLCRNLMVSFQRSYFFSYHTECRDAEKLDAIEARVVDELFDWDEAINMPGE